MKKIFAIAAFACLFTACQKEIKAPEVDFNVEVNKTTFQVGDTVKFQFSGNPDNITFFSGEPGMKYKYRERTKAEGTPQFSFTSYRQYGVQQGALHVFVSTDFNGTVDEHVGDATWKEITDRVTISDGSPDTESGVVDLSEFDNGDPLYIAFRYLGEENETSAQPKYTITDFVVRNVLDDGVTLEVADMSNLGWSAVSLQNPDREWNISASSIIMAGGPPKSPDNDDWAVTRGLNLSKVLPDRGFALKNITSQMDGYDYVYTTPGEYTVTFLATNATKDEMNTVVRELNITVTP